MTRTRLAAGSGLGLLLALLVAGVAVLAVMVTTTNQRVTQLADQEAATMRTLSSQEANTASQVASLASGLRDLTGTNLGPVGNASLRSLSGDLSNVSQEVANLPTKEDLSFDLPVGSSSRLGVSLTCSAGGLSELTCSGSAVP